MMRYAEGVSGDRSPPRSADLFNEIEQAQLTEQAIFPVGGTYITQLRNPRWLKYPVRTSGSNKLWQVRGATAHRSPITAPMSAVQHAFGGEEEQNSPPDLESLGGLSPVTTPVTQLQTGRGSNRPRAALLPSHGCLSCP